MRTTIILKPDLMEKAAKLSQICEKTALIHEGLRALIEKYSAQRLAAIGGKMPEIKSIPRRKSKKK